MFGARIYKARIYLARIYGAGRTPIQPPQSGLVSQNFLDGLYPQESAAVILLLLTIEGGGLATPIRVVNNTADISSNGLPYVAFPFEVTLPDDVESEGERSVGLKIDNVSREIAQAIQEATGMPDVTLQVILASAPDVIERGPFLMQLRQAAFDAGTVTGRLAFQDLLAEPFGGYSFTPGDFPALFG